ncbi:glycoside hydrolase family 3 N-terminal domain-containing protein [Demequina lutea]|uniref:beta-N-acetylhexosaminidase n=1 Tax=Demequina lutea TaxID=431489 RepID=A0A7Y9Z9W0_9MICO|nr:glycoside hydrolase family 3 N-terminal domain-containing protein [Demequina lutea]NYI40668.1 beta-N-acetylhexosaminidase [Demequina lutea]
MRRSRVIAAATAIAVVAGGSAAWVALRQGGQGHGAAVADAVVAPIAAPVERAPLEVPADLAWGPSVVDYADAVATASDLPLDVAAGQVIVATVSSPDPATAASLVSAQHLAGVILMGGAITDASQVGALAAAVQAAAAEDGRSWPAVVSTDQEGGPVSRLSGVIPGLPAFMAAGSIPDKTVVANAYESAARDMRALGVNVDWAPDADVTVGLADPTIRVRSAGSDPARVADTVDAAVKGLLAGGVIPAIKHFPGHGSVTTDSHVSVPVQTATVAQLETADLVPFAQAIADGAPVVMMGHIAVAEWGGVPATVSPRAYAYVRKSLGFTGVVVTDALNMGAITDSFAPGDSEVAALAAGADLLLMPRDPAAARQAIIAAVQNGTLSRDRLDEAVARVSSLMTLQQRRAEASDTKTVESNSGANYARAFAASAATVSAASCTGPYVGSSVTIRGGWPGERQALADALAGYGITTGGGTTILLLGSATGSGRADVVVAMDGPWGLPKSTASVYVGLYGRSNEALAGLADVLAGAVTPTGQWAVAGMPPACGTA